MPARRLVGAEQRQRPLPARRLDRNREDGNRGRDAVEHAEAAEAAPAQEQRRRQHGREKRERLLARLVRDHAEREQPELVEPRRPLEHAHEHEHDEKEDRVERVLGHQRARVDERRDRDGQRSRRDGEGLVEDAPRKQVRGHGGERHHDRVDRLGRLVRIRDRGEGAVRRADQQWIDDAVRAACGNIPDQEPAVRGEALRELRVDELVDHDPRRDHPAGEQEANRGRDDDDPGHPHPGRNGAGDRAGVCPRHFGLGHALSAAA